MKSLMHCNPILYRRQCLIFHLNFHTIYNEGNIKVQNYNFSVKVRFPKIGGIGPLNKLPLRSLKKETNRNL